MSPARLALCDVLERPGLDLEPFARLTLLSVRVDEGHAGKVAALAPAGNTSS